MRFIHVRQIMGLLDNKKYAVTARVFYLHILYVVMLGLGAGILGNFNAEYGDDDNHEHRYLNCALVGATNYNRLCRSNSQSLSVN